MPALASSPGIAAATIFSPSRDLEVSEKQLRVAFDGDAVLFSDESEQIVKAHGLDKFFEHEKAHENKPLAQVELGWRHKKPLADGPGQSGVRGQQLLARGVAVGSLLGTKGFSSTFGIARVTAKFLLTPSGPLEGLPGGAGEAAEEVLLQGAEAGVPHPHVPGDSKECSQLRSPGPKNSP